MNQTRQNPSQPAQRDEDRLQSLKVAFIIEMAALAVGSAIMFGSIFVYLLIKFFHHHA